MKRLSCAMFILILLVCVDGTVSSQPIAGMELSLTSLGVSNYQVKYTYYRDCGAVNPPQTVPIQFQCPSNPTLNFNINYVPLVSSQEVTPACTGVLTRCTGGSYEGYQANAYQTMVTLAPCSNWIVSTYDCCRAISQTIQGVSGMYGYIETRLNNLDAPYNSSPVFSNNPINFMCTGQESVINHGALDPDGDSLSYAFANPFISSGTSFVIWNPPYTASQPITSNPPVSLHPITGELRMKPTMNIQSLMLLKVDQWRDLNGVPTLVGTTYRDIKLTSISCNNQLPVLGGMSAVTSAGYSPSDTIFFKDVCIGDTVSFTIHGFDADTANSSIPGNREKFHISWNQGIPQASFQVSGQDSDSAFALFTWATAPATRGMKCFTATIHDFACPYYGVQTYTYCLILRGIAATLTPDTAVCQGEQVTFHVATDPPAADFLWSIDGVPVLTPAPSNTLFINTSGMSPGLHTIYVEAIDGNPAQVCTGKALSKLRIYPLPTVFLGNDTLLAAGSAILLDAGAGYTCYHWSTGAMTQTVPVDSAGTGIGTKTVWVEVTDNFGCKGTDTININFNPNPGIEKNLSENGLSIIPNPADGKFRLVLNAAPAGEILIEVFQADGKLVFSSKYRLQFRGEEIPIELHQPENGICLLKVTHEDGIWMRKLIIRN
jgi:hypothetical protein